jgi:hypothetical protein
MITRMTSLMYLYQFSFDYLLSGYLPYLLLAILAIAICFVLYRVFISKHLVGVATEKETPEQKEPAASDQALSSFNLQNLKKTLDELKAGQNTLIEHLASVQTVLEQMQVDLYNLKQSKGAETDHNPERHNYKTQRNNPPAQFSQATNRRESASALDMTELYNASRTDQSSRAKFREKYKPFCINVANDVDRRRNANLAPDFRKEDDGSYLAVSQETDHAMVFPNFTLIVVDAVYGPGALSEVFECDSFDRRFSYPYIRVATPATFKSTGGQSWRVIHKGTLELGPGQDD